MTGSEEALFKAFESSSSLEEVMNKLRIKVISSLRRRIRRYKEKHGALPILNDASVIAKESYIQKNFLRNLNNHINLQDFTGKVAIFSDAHFHPDLDSDAFLLFLKIIDEVKPDLIINNGDAFDGSSISRFPRIGWEPQLTVIQEIKACQRSLDLIQKASPDSKRYWCVGNHDFRLDTYLSNHAGQFEGVPGTKLSDHFQEWTFSVSLSINDSLMIKHRLMSGIHAAFNNTLKAGVSIATGHTHRLLIRSWSDYTGKRYGIECGTLADPYGPQFAFMENAPRDWSSGFVLITVDQDAINPQIIEVVDGKTIYNGKEWSR